jgi:dihydroorotase
VRTGKERGIAVSAEVTPHHFTLTDEALRERGGYDTSLKMNRRSVKRPIGWP